MMSDVSAAEVCDFMEVLNGTESAVQAARACGVVSLIGNNDGMFKTADGISDYNPALIDYKGDSAISAGIGAVLFNKRVLLASMSNDVKRAALMRLPMVSFYHKIKNYSIVFLPQSSQEVFDDLVAAYAISEDKKVLLPVVVKSDPLLNATYESVDVPSQKIIENMIGHIKMEKPDKHIKLKIDDNLEGKMQLQKAVENSRKVIADFSEKWRKKFKRTISVIDSYLTEDAETVLVVYGPNSGNALLAVKQLREKGEKAGLLRIHLFRPWPQQEIENALVGARKVAVVDGQVSIGSWSALYSQIKAVTRASCSNYISGPVVSVKDFVDIYFRTKSTDKEERVWMI